MENQANYTKTANIVEMDNNVSIEFFDSENNYLRLAGDEIKDVAENIKKIFEKFKIPKSEEEIEIENLKKEKEELISIIVEKTTLEERVEMPNVALRWEVGEEYTKDDEVNYYDVLYVCKKNHKSSYEDIPVNSPEFWENPKQKKIRPEIYDNEKKYKINDKVYWSFNKHVYSSLIEQEGQSPFASPKTWKDEGVF